MNKIKLFTENMIIYGLGGIISKAIPLVMVPIITMIMPSTDYFGISDLSNTMVQLFSAIAIMGMYDAMYRLFFEKEDKNYKIGICSTALLFTFFSSFVIFLIMIFFSDYISLFFLNDKKYAYVVYISAIATLVGATNGIISAPTRMQNKRKVFLIANTISPLLSYVVSIPLLLLGYYVIALPLAGVISGLTMEIVFGILNHKWFSIKKFDKSLLRELLLIGLPLLPNVIMYWVFNSCDKVMITNIIGIDEAGVYAVGSKLGSASQLIYIAFAGGWQFFAFSTMKEKNQVASNSKIFELLGVVSFSMTTLMCATSYVFFDILFPVDYINGYIIAPYLFMGPLIQMLCQTAHSQFLIIKKTWPSTIILGVGVLVNLSLNLVLIPIYGIEGAAIATLLGYCATCIIDIIVLSRIKLMVLNKKFYIASLLMLFVFFIWRRLASDSILRGMLIFIIYTCVLVLLYKNDIKKIFYSIKGKRS